MRFSYKRAVEWIALNDEPNWRDIKPVSEMISVSLVADMLGRSREQVARDVINLRRKMFDGSNNRHDRKGG